MRQPWGASSRKPQPRRSSTSAAYARAGFHARATGICSTTSGSRCLRRPGPRPSPTATISRGTAAPTTTRPSRRKRGARRSVPAPEPTPRGGVSSAPVVEPLAALLTELPPGHLVAEDLGGLEAAVIERLEQILRNREPHVEPDQVGQLERAHRVVVSQLHRLVDILGRRDALLEHPHGFETP